MSTEADKKEAQIKRSTAERATLFDGDERDSAREQREKEDLLAQDRLAEGKAAAERNRDDEENAKSFDGDLRQATPRSEEREKQLQQAETLDLTRSEADQKQIMESDLKREHDAVASAVADAAEVEAALLTQERLADAAEQHQKARAIEDFVAKNTALEESVKRADRAEQAEKAAAVLERNAALREREERDRAEDLMEQSMKAAEVRLHAEEQALAEEQAQKVQPDPLAYKRI